MSCEELILVAEDSPTRKSKEPPADGPKKTIARIGYEVLCCEKPYTYTEEEFFHEVHVVRRNRPELKIESYIIRRSELVKKYGWGIHRNKNQKLKLVACESEEYRVLLANRKVKKTKAFRISKL